MGLLVDWIAFLCLFRAGLPLRFAHMASFACSAAVLYAANRRRFSPAVSETAALPSFLRYGVVALLAVFLRGGVLSIAHDRWGWSPDMAMLPSALVAGLVAFLGTHFFVFRRPAQSREPGISWRLAAMGLVPYLFALRLIYSSEINLLPEEAYYWNYSQHLSYGYLDHPPMVAWLIWLGDQLLGRTELAVRAGALACSVVTLVFGTLFVRHLIGRTHATIAAILLSILPIFFGAGFLMTPDAPLLACWAGALFFFERALLAGRGPAWMGAGACVGLGLLSKYTMALVPIAALCYVMLDPPSRRWLHSPLPYASALLSLVLFSPVILWNAQNGWVSFAFQGSRRWGAGPRFDFHNLVVFVILLITPLGILGTFLGLLKRAPGRLFCLLFTLIPLSAFVVSSLRNTTKINWTGPVWLAALPFIALSVLPPAWFLAGRKASLLNGCWKLTFLFLVVSAGGLFHYQILGLPSAPAAVGYCGMNWQQLGSVVEDIEKEVATAFGHEPMIVGLDKNHLASELAFYDPCGDGARETASDNIIGKEGLMYGWWFPASGQDGKQMILVAKKQGDLESPEVTEHFERLHEIRQIEVKKHEMVIGRYFARAAFGYRSRPMER
jgi:dolichol-phosphate mannosyltransferase